LNLGLTVGQLLGSVGTSLLNAIFASAAAAYIAAHLTSAPLIRSPGPERAGADTWLRRRVLVDRRHLRQRRGRQRRPAPSPAA